MLARPCCVYSVVKKVLNKNFHPSKFLLIRHFHSQEALDKRALDNYTISDITYLKKHKYIMTFGVRHDRTSRNTMNNINYINKKYPICGKFKRNKYLFLTIQMKTPSGNKKVSIAGADHLQKSLNREFVSEFSKTGFGQSVLPPQNLA